MPNRKRYLTNKEYKKYYREYYQKNITKLRKYKREYNKKWRAEFGFHNETNSKLRYPLKLKARSIFNSAKSRGLVKPKRCIVCNKNKAQAHHPNYRKPLEVVWVCPQHHKDIHLKKLSTDAFVA